MVIMYKCSSFIDRKKVLLFKYDVIERCHCQYIILSYKFPEIQIFPAINQILRIF